MTLTEHLSELRSRLLQGLVAFGLAMAFCLYYSSTVWALLLRPLRDLKSVQLVNLSPSEGLVADFAACALGGLLLSSPFLLFQIHRFIAPALRRQEKTIALPWLWIAWLLFLAGMLFAWWGLVPLLLGFFAGYNPGIAEQQWTQVAYAGFLLRFCAALGLYFELPAVVWLLARWGVLRASHLVRHGRIAIFLIFLLAAVWTPPDAVSMLLMALPMLAVYALSIGVAALASPREQN